jgi:hypothetical protein
LSEKPADAHADFGKWSKKLECVFIIDIPSAERRDPARLLPGRASVFIIPQTECIPGSLLNEQDTGRYMSNTLIRALLVLNRPSVVDQFPVGCRVQIASQRDTHGGMTDIHLTAVDPSDGINDMMVTSGFPPKTLTCTAIICRPVPPNEQLLNLHRMSEKVGAGKKIWLENVSRFKPAEMKAGIDGILDGLLHSYTLAVYFTTLERASAMCQEGPGIDTAQGPDGSCTLQLCLRRPAELGWQKNAGGRFKDNVAQLLPRVSRGDVQAMIVLGVPSDAVERAGCQGQDTFTITERPGQLKLLNETAAGKIVYANAHIAKVYELEPGSLVEKRWELAKLDQSAAPERESLMEEIRRIEAENEAVPAEGVPPEGGGGGGGAGRGASEEGSEPSSTEVVLLRQRLKEAEAELVALRAGAK